VRRGQSEALGALLLSILIAMALLTLSSMLRAERSYISSYNEIAYTLSMKRIEEVRFSSNSSGIYAMSTIPTELIAEIVFANGTLYYENFTAVPLPQQTWVSLSLPNSSEDYLTLYKNASLVVLTKRGNLFVYSPIEQTQSSATIALKGSLPMTGKFSMYYVGNNTRLLASYSLTLSGSSTYDPSSGTWITSITGSFSIAGVWIPVAVLYTGSPRIYESWAPNSNSFNLTVEGSQGGRFTLQMKADGSAIAASSSSLISFKKMKMILFLPSLNMMSAADTTIYRMPGGELLAVLTAYPSTSGSYLSIAAKNLLDSSVVSVSTNSYYTYNSAVNQGCYSYSYGSGCHCSSSDFISSYADVYQTTYAAGVSFSGSIDILLVDTDTMESTALAISPSALIISDLRGEGYHLNLDPPSLLKMASGYTAQIETPSWSFNRVDQIGSNPVVSWTNVTKTVSLPNGYPVSVSGYVYMKFSYSYGTPSPGGGGSSSPPKPSPSSIELYYIEVPMPTSLQPENTTIYIYTESADPVIAPQLRAIYSIYNEQEAKYEVQNATVQFSPVDTPLGSRYGVSFVLSGNAQRTLAVQIYLGSQLIGWSVFKNSSYS